MRKSPGVETYKLLYVRSGNECAFPDCKHPIFNDNGVYIAQLCHIKAANKGGQRYDYTQTNEERRAIDNLLFMCHRHHKETDDENLFDVSAMTKIKKNHESQFTEEGKILSDKMLQQIDLEERFYWNRQRNKKFTFDELKMKTNFDNDMPTLFNEVQNSLELIYDYCKTCAHSDNSTTLDSDLKKLLDLAELDFSKIQEVPYYKNPFAKRNWEYHNIGLPNLFNKLYLNLYQLKVKTFENMLKLEPENEEIKSELSKYRHEFESIFEDTYYVD